MRLVRALLILGLAGALSCATGQRQFHAGQKAQSDGDLAGALAAYRAALKEEPSNAEYKSAIDKIAPQAAQRYEEDAKAKEKQENWSGASADWAKASEALPDNQDYKARKALSALKAQNLGPDEWYEAVKKISAELPSNAIVEKSLADKRSKASAFHLQAGDKHLGANEWASALKEWDRAKEIDPAAPGLDSEQYESTAALAIMDEGDKKLDAGDAIEAYDLYQRAYDKRPLPLIKARLQKVKAKASAVLGKIDSAKALSQKGKHLDALKIYESLAGTKGVPPSVAQSVLQERTEVARQEAERAEKSAEAGDLARAKKSLDEALRYATLEPAALEALKSASSEIDANHPGKAIRAIDDAKLDAKEPAVKAARACATGAAKKTVEKARAISKRDAAGALELIADLGPFEETIPAIKQLRQDLRAGSFHDMLEEALKTAKKGNDEEAATLLLAALNATSAPQEVRGMATAASDSLKAKHYAEAEIGYQKVLALEPRSKLAQKGAEIARLRRKAAEKAALDALKVGGEDEGQAIEVLEASLTIESNAAAAKQGEAILIGRARAGKAMSDADLAKLVRSASRLAHAPAAAKPLEEGAGLLEKGDAAGAEAAFGRALEAVPSLEIAKIARARAKERAPAASKAEPAKAESAAKAEPAEKAAASGAAEPAKTEHAKAEPVATNAPAKSEPAKSEPAKSEPKSETAKSEPAKSEPAKREPAKSESARTPLQASAAPAEEKAAAPENKQPQASSKPEPAEDSRDALIQGSLELKNGGDLARGAKATAKLLKLDPNSAEAKAAIAGAAALAEKAAQSGDDKTAAQLFRAAADASGESKDLSDGLIRWESGKYDEALKELEHRSSDLGRRAYALVKARKLGTLKAGLAGDDHTQAEAIKALFTQDPANKEAQAALLKLLDKAKASGAKGDDKGAQASLEAAALASTFREDLANTLSVASTHLGEKRYAQAEKAYLDAIELVKDSKVAKTGLEIARKGREKIEKEALANIAGAPDPSVQAKVLQSSLLVEPSSKAVSSAAAALAQRAKKAGAKPDDRETAAVLNALALLENAGSDTLEAMSTGGAALAKGSFEEAESAYAGIENSKAAELGKELARKRRITVLRADLDSAKKSGDVLLQSKTAATILQLDPQDKAALDTGKRLKGSVVDSRLAAARAEKASGKLGVAYLYLRRALESDPGNAKAKAEFGSLEAALKEGLDLVVLVDQVARAPSVAGAQCMGIEASMRDALMSEGSKRNDLGAYVLSPDWTKAVERKDPKSPQVSGKLVVTLAKCQSGSATGHASLEYELDVPPEHGTQVVKGSAETDLPAGLVPRDEQDGEGKNARAALSRRAAKALFDKVANDKATIDQWLLSLAEQGVKQRDSALAADAYARLMVKRPPSMDASRVSQVERYLDAEYK